VELRAFSVISASLFSLLLLFSSGECVGQINSKPEKGTCGFYAYQDSIRQCRKRGYLMNFGYKYCNFFLGSHFDKFSDEGQQWALEMGYCLQLKLDEISDSVSCKALNKIARKSHLPCLIESGYVNIPKKDKRLYKRLGARNPLNWPAGLYYTIKLKKAVKHQKDAD